MLFRKRILIALFTSGMIILMSLAFETFNKWTRYIIEPGTQAEPQLLGQINEIEFAFRTNSTWYNNEKNTNACNKIKGISHGDYQINSSALLAYQCINDSILLVGAYCFVDGQGPEENAGQFSVLDTLYEGQEYDCRIVREDGKYKFYFEDKYWDCPAGEDLDWGFEINPDINEQLSFGHDWMVDLCMK